MTTNPDKRTDTHCPACGGKGKAVKPITIKSLVDPAARNKLTTLEGLRFCPGLGCDVAYFNTTTGETISKADVTVRIGQKETNPPRPVCYCFGHTAESIHDELAKTGTSVVFDEISAKCKQGLDRCAQTNPQGSCCLANVRAAIKNAQADLGITDTAKDTPQPDCCSASGNPASQMHAASPARTGLWASAQAQYSPPPWLPPAAGFHCC